tara:strand:- start:464 stop:877 length:414 start_codon:yes stop_codon:yes gene_type:complete
MNFFKKPKLILSIVVIFVVLIQLSQTNKLPSVFQKIFDFINLFLVGPIFLLLFICLGVYGILIFYKNVLPNPTDAEMRAIKRKIKNKSKFDKSMNDSENIKKETKTLVEKIRKLKQLYKKGTLTEIEFEQAKEKLLN